MPRIRGRPGGLSPNMMRTRIRYRRGNLRPLIMVSLAVTADATTRMRTWFLPGVGGLTSITRRTSGGPQPVQTAAFILVNRSAEAKGAVEVDHVLPRLFARLRRPQRRPARVDDLPGDWMPSRIDVHRRRVRPDQRMASVRKGHVGHRIHKVVLLQPAGDQFRAAR